MPEDRIKQYGLIKGDEELLRTVWRTHREMWILARRMKIREVLKAIEYDKGNQYIVWDYFGGAYYNPFSGPAPGSVQGSEQGNDETNVYAQTYNLIQWLRKVFTSSLSASIPHVEWWPEDAEDDLDNRASKARSRCYRKIMRDNDEKALLEQALDYLFLCGHYFRRTTWSMDQRITGTHYEPTYEYQMQQVAPDRYSCPQCATETPIDINNPPRTMACPNCGRTLTGADFRKAVDMEMPVQTGQKEVPNGQVRYELWNILNVDVMPQADFTAGGVIANTPIIGLSCEVTKGAFRSMYPNAWQKAALSTDSSSLPDAQLERMARERVKLPRLLRATVPTQHTLTYDRVWVTPDAFNILDNKEDADRLKGIFPQGCCASFLVDDLIDIRQAETQKEWTWCGTEKGKGAFPPAVVTAAMDPQDATNDRINAVNEYYDRAGNPPILYNSKLITSGLNGKVLPPATLLPVPVNNEMGRGMQDAFFQPTFKMDDGVHNHIQRLIMWAQLLTGITPQTYGQTSKDINTASGQEQALKVAMGILWGNWNQVRGEFAESANLGVDCYAANNLDDGYAVTKNSDSAEFRNDPIKLEDLSGHAKAYPEADQGYPIGFEEQREIYRELFGMASGKAPNPLVMEILDSYENRRLAMRYLGPPDMELPETKCRYRVLRDIELLIKPADKKGPAGAPIPSTSMTGQQVLLPSVKPDPDFYQPYWELVISTVIVYGLGNYDDIMETNPAGFENLRAYLRLANQLKTMGMAAAQLGQGNLLPPGPAGDEDPGAKPGPVPVPPKPHGVQPLRLQAPAQA